MSYNVSIDENRLAKIRKEAEEQFYKNYKVVVSDELDTLLRKRVTGSGGHVIYEEGPIRTMIKEQVEHFYLSEKSQKRMDQYLEEYFMPELEKTVQAAMTHSTRKRHFPLIEEKVSTIVTQGKET